MPRLPAAALVLALVLALPTPAHAQTQATSDSPLAVTLAPSPAATPTFSRCPGIEPARVLRGALSVLPGAPRVLEVDHLGTPLAGQRDLELVEGGDVTVVVHHPTGLEHGIRIQQTSALRDPNALLLSGSGPKSLQDPPPGASRDTESDPLIRSPYPPGSGCGITAFTIGDLAGGESKLAIDYVAGGDAKTSPLGTLQLRAAARYAGVATFGIAASFVREARYTRVPQVPGDSLSPQVVAVDESRLRPQYVIGVSPFLAGRRTIQRGTQPTALQTIAPFVGFDLQAPLESVFLGATASFKDVVYLTAGVHVRKTTRLPDGLALEAGDVYVGDAIPTVEQWDRGLFLGLTANASPVIAVLGGLFGNVVK